MFNGISNEAMDIQQKGAGRKAEKQQALKLGLSIILLFVFGLSQGQYGVQENTRFLDEALVAKDTAKLQVLLHPALSYGHSNGWVESKVEVIQHLLNGKLTYRSIESKEISSEHTGDDLAVVRSESRISFILDGKPGQLKLHVLQVWKRVGYKWQLIARQSTKTGDH